MSNELTIEQRVAAGAEWLDLCYPGWDVEIDVDRLSISSCTQCVLGQVFGHYGDSPTEARLDPDYVARARGFSGSPLDERLLTEEWKRLILARREAVSCDA